MADRWICKDIECDYKKTYKKKGFCPKCGEPLQKVEMKESMDIINKKRKFKANPNFLKEETEEKEKKQQKTPHITGNPIIKVSFYESMPGRLSLGTSKSYVSGTMEIAEKEIIVHKKSYWRGRERGEKHIRYDKITSIDYDAGKLLAAPSIQLYLSSVEYTFRSYDKRLESFFQMIREKIDETQTQQTSITSSVSPMEELKKLAELRDMGIVTEEEFELKKKQLLGL